MRKKENLEKTKDLILNLKALAFSPIENVNKRFEKINAEFHIQGDLFKNYLGYFQRTWISGKHSIRQWNYSKGVKKYLSLFTIKIIL